MAFGHISLPSYYVSNFLLRINKIQHIGRHSSPIFSRFYGRINCVLTPLCCFFHSRTTKKRRTSLFGGLFVATAFFAIVTIKITVIYKIEISFANTTDKIAITSQALRAYLFVGRFSINHIHFCIWFVVMPPAIFTHNSIFGNTIITPSFYTECEALGAQRL